MSAPREHVEAVAKAIRDHLGAGWNSQSLAKDILNSTDPAVHAALLAALVRADYLSRARELAEVAAELATASGCSPQDALETLVRALTEVVSHAHD